VTAVLKQGDSAPDFEAVDCRRRRVRLSDFRGKKVVLFFFPKAFTPGCTLEVRNFRDNHERILSHNAELIGVSVDKPERSCRFAESENLNFALLGDDSRAISTLYGVLWPVIRVDKRATFVIDENGVIEDVIDEEVHVHRHLEVVLERLGAAGSVLVLLMLALLALSSSPAYADVTDAAIPDASVGQGGADRTSEEVDNGAGSPCLSEHDCDFGMACSAGKCVYRRPRSATTGCSALPAEAGVGATAAAWLAWRRRQRPFANFTK
jgi:peroxiredoxin Q/BCP